MKKAAKYILLTILFLLIVLISYSAYQFSQEGKLIDEFKAEATEFYKLNNNFTGVCSINSASELEKISENYDCKELDGERFQLMVVFISGTSLGCMPARIGLDNVAAHCVEMPSRF